MELFLTNYAPETRHDLNIKKEDRAIPNKQKRKNQKKNKTERNKTTRLANIRISYDGANKLSHGIMPRILLPFLRELLTGGGEGLVDSKG